jgi:hypothetical protein
MIVMTCFPGKVELLLIQIHPERGLKLVEVTVRKYLPEGNVTE